jgi:hypothetical protein
LLPLLRDDQIAQPTSYYAPPVRPPPPSPNALQLTLDTSSRLQLIVVGTGSQLTAGPGESEEWKEGGGGKKQVNHRVLLSFIYPSTLLCGPPPRATGVDSPEIRRWPSSQSGVTQVCPPARTRSCPRSADKVPASRKLIQRPTDDKSRSVGTKSRRSSNTSVARIPAAMERWLIRLIRLLFQPQTADLVKVG